MTQDLNHPEATESAAWRVESLARLSQVLSGCDVAEASFILEEFGVQGSTDLGSTRRPELLRVLRSSRATQLGELRDYVLREDFAELHVAGGRGSETDARDAGDRPLNLFASHLTAKREAVESVQEAMADWGVEMFVASASIDPETEWAEEIEEALDLSHAGVAFLHPGFSARAYCQQEIGWLCASRRPVLRLKLGEDPTGMLAGHQGVDATEWDTARIARHLRETIGRQPSLEAPWVTSLTSALESSPSFHRTDQLWAALPDGAVLRTHQVDALLRAAEENTQVFRARNENEEGRTYRELIAERLRAATLSAAQEERVLALDVTAD